MMSYNHYSQTPAFKHEKSMTGRMHGGISRWHLAGIILCAALLFSDFLTTTIALSIARAQALAGSAGVTEGNPLMMGVVNDPATFLLSKLAILGLVVGAAYILRNNGFMAYMPYVIVGGMYLFAVLNNLNVLWPAI